MPLLHCQRSTPVVQQLLLKVCSVLKLFGGLRQQYFQPEDLALLLVDLLGCCLQLLQGRNKSFLCT